MFKFPDSIMHSYAGPIPYQYYTLSPFHSKPLSLKPSQFELSLHALLSALSLFSYTLQPMKIQPLKTVVPSDSKARAHLLHQQLLANGYTLQRDSEYVDTIP